MALRNTVWRYASRGEQNWQGKGNMTKKMGLCLQRGIRLPISPARVKDSSPVEKQRQVCLHKLNHTAIQKRKNYAQDCAKGLDICGGMSGTSIRLLFAIKKRISYHNSEHMSANIWGFAPENWETMNSWKNKSEEREKKVGKKCSETAREKSLSPLDSQSVKQRKANNLRGQKLALICRESGS